MTKEIMRKVFAAIEADAADKAMAAGYDGQPHDYGASALRRQVKYYKAGMGMKLPANWKKYYDKVVKAEDPEWAEYERLHKKFSK
jgi:hypothetical protein